MSHVAVQSTTPGDPMFKDMEALKLACQMLGLEIEQRSNYAWFNRHVGDYPLPQGIPASDLGKNAKFVIRLNDEMAAKHGNPHTKPYEIGMLEDPNNPGCFVPIYDFFAGGYGLEAVIGKPLFADKEKKKPTMLCPLLKQRYEMALDALSAAQAGDKIEFLTLRDAHAKYPEMFEKSNDELTWVSIVDPTNRVQVNN